MEQLREALHRHLAPRRHTALLIAIVALFMVRPLIGDGRLATATFSTALLILLLFALYAIQGGRHMWPGLAISGNNVPATDLMWSFFTQHPKP